MNLYKLSQTFNNDWDTYDSCVVVASTPEDARRIHPDGSKWPWHTVLMTASWAIALDQISIEYIGTASDDIPPGTVIVASFNAG